MCVDQVVNTVEDRQPQQRHQHHQISITHISQRPPLPHVPTRALPVSHFHYPSDPSSNNVSLADHADIYQQWPNHQREINVANNLTSIPPVPFTKPLITLHHHRHELQQPQPVLSHHHSVGGSRPPLPAYDEVLRQNPGWLFIYLRIDIFGYKGVHYYILLNCVYISITRNIVMCYCILF